MIARRPPWKDAWQEGSDANQVTMAAFRAVTQRLAGEQLVAVPVVQRHIRHLDNGRRFCKQLSATSELDCAVAVGQQAVMPNPLESARQNVQQEAAQTINSIRMDDSPRLGAAAGSGCPWIRVFRISPYVRWQTDFVSRLGYS